MKPAPPDSLSEAAQRAQCLLSADHMARVSGLSTSMIYKLGDPDQPHEPTLSRAVRIDRECRATNNTTPFLRAYLAQLEGAPSGANAPDITESMLEVTMGLGHLAGAVKSALCPNGPGGQAMTPRERAEISAAIDKAEHSLNQIRGVISDG